MFVLVASRFPCFDDAKLRLFAYTHKYCFRFFQFFISFLTYINTIVCEHKHHSYKFNAAYQS